MRPDAATRRLSMAMIPMFTLGILRIPSASNGSSPTIAKRGWHNCEEVMRGGILRWKSRMARCPTWSWVARNRFGLPHAGLPQRAGNDDRGSSRVSIRAAKVLIACSDPQNKLCHEPPVFPLASRVDFGREVPICLCHFGRRRVGHRGAACRVGRGSRTNGQSFATTRTWAKRGERGDDLSSFSPPSHAHRHLHAYARAGGGGGEW